MRLRFQILSPTNTGAPDYIICNQSVVNVGLTSLSLVVKVDGTDIINTTNLSGVSFPVPNVTTTNGIIVSNITLVNSFFVEMEIDLLNVYDKTTLELSSSKTGYLPYSNVFEIYGYDLGNNPNQINGFGNPIDYNPSMDIHLINETNNVVNGKQTKAYSAFTTYIKPYTNTVHYYTLTSSQGTITYTNELGTIYNGKNGFHCLNSDTELIQTNVVSNAQGVISTCVSALIQANVYTLFPDFNVSSSCLTNCPTDCVSTIESLNSVSAFIDYNILSSFWKNDTFVTPYTNQYLSYKIYDYTGVEILNLDYSYSISPSFIFTPSTYSFDNFQLPEKGDYIIKVELGVTDVWKCEKILKIENCHWYEVQKVDCDKYEVHNNSFGTIDLEISELNSDKVFEVIATESIQQLDSYIVQHSKDGIYQYKVTRTGVSYVYLVFNYCNMQKCILDSIGEILCPKNECGCVNENDKCELYYDFNAKLINAITYFNMLNSEYNFNFLYDSITPNKLDELYNIKCILDRFEEYCNDCNSKCNCGCS